MTIARPLGVGLGGARAVPGGNRVAPVLSFSSRKASPLTGWTSTGSPTLVRDKITGATVLRTGLADKITSAPGTAAFLASGPFTVITTWRSRKYNAAGAYPVWGSTAGGTVRGAELLACDDFVAQDYRRFMARVWNGSAHVVNLPSTQNAGHWIDLKWHVVTLRMSATQLDLRIDGRYVDVNPETIALAFPGGGTAGLSLGGGRSDYQTWDGFNSWLSDADTDTFERETAQANQADLIVRIAGDLRAPAGPESYCGFPGLEHRPDGKIIATYFVGSTESTNVNRIDAKVSSDKGYTWSDAVTIAASDTTNCWANINPSKRLSNGDVVGSFYEIASASIQRLRMIRSTDGAKTWGPIATVTLGSAWEGCSAPMVEDPANPGHLHWPVYTGESASDPNYKVWNYKSIDNGATRTRYIVADGVALGTPCAEAAFLFEPDGSMYCLFRNAKPPAFDVVNYMQQTRSLDKGQTWAAPNDTTMAADSAGQGLINTLSGMKLWPGRPGNRHPCAIFSKPPGAVWNDHWNNVPDAPWIDFVHGGFGGMSYGGIIETSPGVYLPIWGATTDAWHDDVCVRPNFLECYITRKFPGNSTPLVATVIAGQTQQITSEGIGDYTYAFTANPSGCSISASGLFTAGSTANGVNVFTVNDCNGHKIATCSYTVTGAAFTPPQAARVIMHLRPQDGVTQSATLVSSVPNLTGATSAFTQSNGSLKPVYGTAKINGLNVLDCSGGKVLAGTIPGSVTNLTVMMVVKDIASSSGYHGHMGNTDVGGPAFYIKNSIMAVYDYTANGEVAAFTNGISDGTSNILTWRRNGNTWDFFVNGVKTNNAGNPLTASALPTSQFLGATSAAAGNPSGNWIGEVYAYDVALSDSEVVTLQTAMKAEWGTP